MRKGVLVAVAVACLIGASIAALSTSQYLRIQKEGLEEKSFCAISEVIDCDIASASSYSSFAGVPVSSLGFVAYLLMGGMALFGAISKRDRRPTVTVAWLLSIAAVLYSIRMAYALIFVLGVVCLECLGMYAVNLLAAVALWIALRIPVKDTVRFLIDYAKAVFKRPSTLGFAPQFLTHAVIVVVFFVLGWVVMLNAGVEGKDKVTLKEKIDAHYMQSLYAVEPSPEWPVWGNPNGKVTIIEFSDFECPFCRLAAFNIRPYLHEFRKDIRFSFVNYPLDQSCNPYMEFPMHQKACMAADAAQCALERGDFWSFHDDLFRLKKDLGRDAVVKLAQKRGWNEADFEACMDSDTTKKIILDEVEAGRKMHISGTPAIIINGRKLKYWRDPELLRAIVEKEIDRSK